ncbi:GNAT family N-acetyltransferase [Methyloraptor flagellatus]|uniref:GNAT family N-acetyltransferase n=1 Tax=Methyloraptor flagellatus TaxID=3162530 RepID=A0AAU7XJL3_9HYPH
MGAFECAAAPLNTFLQKHALQSQAANAAQTYVAAVGDAVAGYYSLTVGQVVYEDAPERLAKGLARHPVPVMILARLAVDRTWTGRGLGAALLKDALLRTAAAADIAGIRAVVVHAKDEPARAFYAHFGFEGFPDEPLHLYLLMKTVKALAAS